MNIAVKLPNSLEGRLHAFPFLHALQTSMKVYIDKINETKDKDDKEEELSIHLLSVKDDIDVLNLLPFQAYYHEFDELELKTVFTVHRACVNLKIIQKIDLYISLTESFVDASIGKNLGADYSIGFNVNKNNFFLNSKVNKPLSGAPSEIFFAIFNGIKVEEYRIPDLKPVRSRNLDPLYFDYMENPYIVINLPLEKGDIPKIWKDYFDLNVNMNFVLTCDEKNEIKAEDILTEFVETLPSKNTYKIYFKESLIELGKILSYSQYFICEEGPKTLISTYIGCETLVMSNNITENKYKNFIGEISPLVEESFVPESKDDYLSKVFDGILKATTSSGGNAEDEQDEGEEESLND